MLVKYHTVSYCDAPIVRYFCLKITLLWTQQLDALLSWERATVGSAAEDWLARKKRLSCLHHGQDHPHLHHDHPPHHHLLHPHPHPHHLSLLPHLWDINATGKASVCCLSSLNNTDSPLSITVQLNCSKCGQNFLDWQHTGWKCDWYANTNTQVHKYKLSNGRGCGEQGRPRGHSAMNKL